MLLRFDSQKYRFLCELVRRILDLFPVVHAKLGNLYLRACLPNEHTNSHAHAAQAHGYCRLNKKFEKFTATVSPGSKSKYARELATISSASLLLAKPQLKGP